MTKNRLVIVLGLVIVMGISSCGIFGKGCGCPTFGEIKTFPGSSLPGTKESQDYTLRFV